MRTRILSAPVLSISLFAIILLPICQVTTAGISGKVWLFDSRTLYVHGYTTYRYNSNAPSDVEFSMPLWANNFWSDVSILQTTPVALGDGYAKLNASSGEYIEAYKDDIDAIYGVSFGFASVQPYQEIRADVWMKLSISKVDMSGVLSEDVGNVSAIKNLLTDYNTCINETYYWDYSNPSVQQVIQEINATLGSPENVYDIVYATTNWFSKNMVYMEHEDYPNQRLKASQVLNETIEAPGNQTKRYGVCRHFVDAFIAIMRGFGIPANLFDGIVFYDMGGTVGIIFAGSHAWCEVYMPNLGWVPLEVTIPDELTRDVVRVGLISDYYYFPIYKEVVNLGPKPAGQPTEPYQNLIASYWGWGVGEVPMGTLEGIIHAITSIPVIDWILLVLIIALAIDGYMMRKKIGALTRL